MSDNEEEDYFSNSGSEEEDDDDNQSLESAAEQDPVPIVKISEDEDEDEDEADEDEVDYDDAGEDSDVESVSSNIVAPSKTLVGIASNQPKEDDSDEDSDDSNDENYLQKFDTELNETYISTFHPECSINNYDEISILSKVIRDANNNIIDPFHKTTAILTKYERARIIGQRAKQINSGAKPFIKIPDNIIDGSIIAEMELEQKRVPFIIRRPLPNGTCEYWNVRDLEILV